MNIPLKAPEKLVVYNRQMYKFIVIGCGGTGAYLVRDLARIISIYNQQFNRSDSMLLIDGDDVEEHNLARQNFIRSDIGKNKSQVLAERYGNAYNLRIGFIPRYIHMEDLDVIRSQYSNYAPVFIGCVDNNKTRHIIHTLYRRSSISSIYLDSGNEEYAGQVVFSTTVGYTVNAYQLQFLSSMGSDNVIKDAVEYFHMQPDDRHPDDLSCAERSVHAPQNIATNLMAADVLFNYCNAILCASAQLSTIDLHDVMTASEAMKTSRGISAYITFFNAQTGAISSRPFEDRISASIERHRVEREPWIREEKERRQKAEDTRRAMEAAAEAAAEAQVTTAEPEAIVATQVETTGQELRAETIDRNAAGLQF